VSDQPPVATKQPCPRVRECGSSDAAAYYDNPDGSKTGFCFSCSKPFTRENSPYKPMNTALKPSKPKRVTEWGKPPKDAWRSLTQDTLLKYGVVYDEVGDRYGFPYTSTLKVRGRVDKEFASVKEPTLAHGKKDMKGDLFGQNLFPEGGKFVTITEGEGDCMALYQAFGANYAVLSIPHGAASALRDCEKAFEYLDSFQSVVVCFDADEPGKKAALEVALLFAGKSKIVELDPALKDANGYLMAGKSKELVSAWWAAKEYRPSDIFNMADMHEMITTPVVPPLFMWPYKELNDMSDGVRPGELVTLTAGTGIGKSSFAREIVDHVLQTTTGFKIGMMMLEESPTTTVKRQVAIRLKRPIYRTGCQVDQEVLDRAFQSVTRDRRLEVYSQLKVTSPEQMLDRLKFMIKGLGCKLIILDHLTIVMSGSDSDNERQAIDKFMTNLRALTESTGSVLILISHLNKQTGKDSHEEGGRVMLSHLKGSGGIAQLSDFTLAAERAQQSEDPSKRMTTLWRFLKNRWTGDTGPACLTRYDPALGVSVYVGPASSASEAPKL
jgi:twinkle protein